MKEPQLIKNTGFAQCTNKKNNKTFEKHDLKQSRLDLGVSALSYQEN